MSIDDAKGTCPVHAHASGDAPFLDVRDPAFAIRSSAVVVARGDSWYARTPYGLAVLRYNEVKDFLKHPSLGQGARRWPDHNGVTGKAAEWWHSDLLQRSGPDHARRRRVLNPAFSPRVVDTLTDELADLANELIDAFEAKGSCDFVAEFSSPYAARVICRALGVGDERWEQIAEWVETLGLALGVTFASELPRIEEAIDELGEFADEVIDAGRRRPAGLGVLSHLIEACDAGRINDTELRESVMNVFFGGIDTTRNQLGIALNLFVDHPEQWDLLARQPNLASAAITEVMRLEPTTTWVTREALEDFDYGGVSIPKGTTIHLYTGLIGTDPSAFGDDAGTFDISVDRANHNFGFGGGQHYCLGHFLARADMAVAIAQLARRLESLERDGNGVWLPQSGNTGPLELPLRFRARSDRPGGLSTTS